MIKILKYIFLPLICYIFISASFDLTAAGQENGSLNSNSSPAKVSKTQPAVNSKTAGSTSEARINSNDNKLDTAKNVKQKKENSKKKKAIYIFDTIITGLMHILIGAFIGVIVLIILKWYFLEREIK